MAQYSEGAAKLVFGSATVDGIGTAFLAEVQPGQLFTRRDSGVTYQIAAVVSDTRLLLAAPYGGVSEESAPYSVHRDFTGYLGLPVPAPGDIEQRALWTRGMLTLEQFYREMEPGFNFVEARSDTPPAQPVVGATYLVLPNSTGAWAGKGNTVAVWDGAQWTFAQPRRQWRVHVAAEDMADYIYDGASWNPGVLANILANAGGGGGGGTTTPTTIEGVSINGQNVNLQPGGAISITGNNNTKTITISEAHSTTQGNPHGTSKADIGLGSVNNVEQLEKAQNLGDLPNVGQARGNLGLGDLATAKTSDATLEFTGTGGLAIHSGTTGQRPAGDKPFIRFNSDAGKLELWDGTQWRFIAFEGGGGSGTQFYVTVLDDDGSTLYKVPIQGTVLPFSLANGTSSNITATNGQIPLTLANGASAPLPLVT